MLLDRQTPALILTVRCLLSLWLFFGCLELAEHLQFVAETLSEDQQEQDLDEEALVQLASGLKSDVRSLFTLNHGFVLVERSEPAISLPFSIFPQFAWMNAVRFLPLYQQHSVYRI